MGNRINIEQVLFLDIETVPAWPDYTSVPEPFLRLWDKKAGFICKEGQTPEMIYDRAGIYAEFGKIICISSGFLALTHNEVAGMINKVSGLNFEVTRSMVWGIVCIGGSILILFNILLTRITIIKTIKYNAR